MYIRVTLYCGHLITLWQFHLGISCTVCFNLYCGGFILFCSVCVCVCVLVICILYSYWGFSYPDWDFPYSEVFPCFLLSCKANARVKLAKVEHGPHSSKLVVICVVLLLFALFHVLFGCKCILYYCHRVTTQMQLTNISYHISLKLRNNATCKLRILSKISTNQSETHKRHKIRYARRGGGG